MGHIFISYSHKDKEYVHKLQDALQREGFEVWIDDRIDYGDEWPMIIQERLDTCDAFVLVATADSYKSNWVRREVTRAQRINKPFLPLLLGGGPWLSIESTQYVDVRDNSLPPEKFYKRLEKYTPRKKAEPDRPPKKLEVKENKPPREKPIPVDVPVQKPAPVDEPVQKPARPWRLITSAPFIMILIACLGLWGGLYAINNLVFSTDTPRSPTHTATPSLVDPTETAIPASITPFPVNKLSLTDTFDNDASFKSIWEHTNTSWYVLDGMLYSDGSNDDASGRYYVWHTVDGRWESEEYLEMSFRGKLDETGHPQKGRGIIFGLIGSDGSWYDLRVENGYTNGPPVNPAISLSFNSGFPINQVIISKTTPKLGQFYEVKAIREDGVWALWVDGKLAGNHADDLKHREFLQIILVTFGSVVVDDIKISSAP